MKILFIGIITENYGGAFPTWVAPIQVNVLPVNSKVHGEYAHKINDLLFKEGIRSEVDNSDEKLGYRLRNSQMKKIPFTIVVGEKEMENNAVTYRVFGSEEQITVSFEDFKKRIHESIDKKLRY